MFREAFDLPRIAPSRWWDRTNLVAQGERVLDLPALSPGGGLDRLRVEPGRLPGRLSSSRAVPMSNRVVRIVLSQPRHR